jgi:hypothetical protein
MTIDEMAVKHFDVASGDAVIEAKVLGRGSPVVTCARCV